MGAISMKSFEFSDLDRRIIERLSVDARQSNREIGRELGVAEGTIRLRLKRMLDENVIEVLAITNIDEDAAPLIAYLWISVDTGFPVQGVIDRLTKQPQITYVASLIGRADILAITWVEDANDLADYLHNTIDRIPGVGAIRYELAHRMIKHDYTATHIIK